MKGEKMPRMGTMFVHDCQRIAIIREEDGTVTIRLYGDRFLINAPTLTVFGAPEVSVTTDDDERRLVTARHGEPIKELPEVVE